MFGRKTTTTAPAAPVADPRFPDYSKVTGHGYDLDREVQAVRPVRP